MTLHLTRGRTALATAALLLTVAAPAAYAALDGEGTSAAASPAPGRGTPYTETQLFFGTQRPDGGPAVPGRQFWTSSTTRSPRTSPTG